jgi:hypothetical protein
MKGSEEAQKRLTIQGKELPDQFNVNLQVSRFYTKHMTTVQIFRPHISNPKNLDK